MAVVSQVNIQMIEEAILEIISGDAVMGAYVRTIESYCGQFEQDLAHIPRMFPAVFVMFRRSEYRAISNHEQLADFTFSILVASQTLQGNRHARLGTPSHIGVYTMLDDLRNLLVGNPLDSAPDATHLLLLREDAVLNTKALSIYDAQYHSPDNFVRSIYE